MHNSGQTVHAYIGLDRLVASTWAWLDDSTVVPDFWFAGEPGTAFNCGVLVSGNPESGHDAQCAGNGHFYYCERVAT